MNMVTGLFNPSSSTRCVSSNQCFYGKLYRKNRLIYTLDHVYRTLDVLRSQKSSVGTAGGHNQAEGNVSLTPLTQIQADTAILKSKDSDDQSMIPIIRKTKIICTIGPSCCDIETLKALAERGMNVARLNMSHGSHEWHSSVIDNIRKINNKFGFSVAIMVDTEGGSEVHLKGLRELVNVKEGQEIVMSIREESSTASKDGMQIQVSFEGFPRDCQSGDILMIDGGMATLHVDIVRGPDVVCHVVDSGIILPRASVTIRRNGTVVKSTDVFMPVICAKDWNDIDLAIEKEVDFIAVSFIRTADVLDNLRSYIASKTSRSIQIVAKIEAYESLENLESIIASSDTIMIARGDLGAQISITQVPKEQKRIVDACRAAGKAVIVASQLLESMHTLPTPTRAEVADISEAVRQGADAVMLSGETAIGLYPLRTLEVLRDVTMHAEVRLTSQYAPKHEILAEYTGQSREGITNSICHAASSLANSLKARAIFSFTETGATAFALSRMRPSASIFAFTDSTDIRLQCSMWWGIVPFRLDFSTDFETNIRRTLQYCKAQGMCSTGDIIIIVSHIQSYDQDYRETSSVARTIKELPVLGNSIQVRIVE